MNFIKLMFITLVILIITDSIWLGVIAKNLYHSAYRPWLNLEDNQIQFVWWSAALVYLLLTCAIVLFVIPLAKSSLLSAFLYGAAMGAITYGIYDFTCLAIFKDWPVLVSFIDWFWGIFLCAWVSTVAVYLGMAVGILKA